MNQLPYEMPSDLETAIVAFVSYYSYRRYHKALGNVTPSDVLRGRRQEILRRRKEVQAQTIERRRQQPFESPAHRKDFNGSLSYNHQNTIYQRGGIKCQTYRT